MAGPNEQDICSRDNQIEVSPESRAVFSSSPVAPLHYSLPFAPGLPLFPFLGTSLGAVQHAALPNATAHSSCPVARFASPAAGKRNLLTASELKQTGMWRRQTLADLL